MSEQRYYVFTKGDEHSGWMDGCIVWWKQDGHGYTYDLSGAGVFTDEDKEKGYPDPNLCVYVRKELVDERTSSPRLAWWSDGFRKPVYQGMTGDELERNGYDGPRLAKQKKRRSGR